MNILWKSQKGSFRKNNNDYVAIRISNDHFSAVIVDASNKGKAPSFFAKYWAEILLTRYIKQEHESIILLLKNIHKTLIPNYITETASYSLIDIDLKKQNGEIIYVGDCRLGIINHYGINWINKPHTIVNMFPQLDNSYANCLTRVLKARRFTPPDQIKFNWEDGDILVLCTDGYWCLDRDNQEVNCDDISVLKITPNNSEFNLTIDSDCNNIFFITQ